MGNDQHGLSCGQDVVIDRRLRDILERRADNRVAQDFDVVNMHLTTVGVGEHETGTEFTR